MIGAGSAAAGACGRRAVADGVAAALVGEYHMYCSCWAACSASAIACCPPTWIASRGTSAANVPACCHPPAPRTCAAFPLGTAAAGTTFLDQLRAAFLQRMERVKGELGQLVDDAEDMLRVQSTATLDCCRRAEMASQLISKLNIKTVDAEQERPDAIYSAQEEGGDVQEGEAVQGGGAAGSGAGH